MKKLLIVFIIAILSLSVFSSFVAYADDLTLTDDNKTSSIGVNATYQVGGVEKTVYSVDVSWGSMKFTYTDAYKGEWDPVNHVYVGATEAKWSCEDEANVIGITNHSEVSVSISLAYVPENAYSNIKGILSKTLIELDSAVDKLETPFENATLTLSGSLGKEENEVKVGSILISIN